jgi:outer membrane lipoprotein-sorting protein
MKKLLFLITGLMLVAVINAQSLEEIVKKYGEANKQDKISAMSTIKISAKMAMMGMEMPMEMWMKNPNKIKTVMSFNGQEMISAFDGEKGYSINPMSGSADPVEMTPEQVKQTQNQNIFQNQMANFLKEGKLKLLGEENVNDKPAFKIQADLGNGNSSDMFIDKGSYLLVKNSSTVNADGTTVTSDSYPSDYKEINGVLLPMKTTISTQGMDIVLTFDKVEVNIPIEDSVFKLK